MDELRLSAEQIEELAKEVREFLLNKGLWQDVDIYFNGKCYSTHDKESGQYFYNDRENLVEREDDPRNYFEYIPREHLLSMNYETIVCDMVYHNLYPEVKRDFDELFTKRGIYYEFITENSFTCYYI